MTTPYERSLKHSECKLAEIRNRLRELPSGDTVGLVCGSYARREASEHSDIDFFMVSKGGEKNHSLVEEVRSEIEKVVPNAPLKDGAFGVAVDRGEFSRTSEETTTAIRTSPAEYRSFLKESGCSTNKGCSISDGRFSNATYETA